MGKYRQALLFIAVIAVCASLSAQEQGRRDEMQQSLVARYRLSVVGAGFMHGSADAIRRAGGVIVLRRAGLFGSFDRGQLCSNAIRDGQAAVLSGNKDVQFQPGEQFYVNSVTVGSDYVGLGLLTVRTVAQGSRSGRLWASANFFFSRELLNRGDLNSVYATLDQWFTSPEPGQPTLAAPAMAAPPAAAPVVAEAQLKPGMSRDEIISALGKPVQEVNFGERSWLTYPGMVAVLEQNKLVSVDRSSQPPAKVSVVSEPPGADVYVDGSFVSSTPANLQLPAGTYKVSVQSKGFQPWQREVRVYGGAEINLRAQLEPASSK